MIKDVDIFNPSIEEITLARRKAMLHSFSPNHAYKIFSTTTTSNTGDKVPKIGLAGLSWERDCVFVFLRKEGKHHVFKELHGGWIRTYTDAQLIGKKILEVIP